MQLYHYNPETGEYLGNSAADLDPLETELAGEPRYLIPAYATTVQPPGAVAHGHYAVVWTGEGWDVVEDHRGETWYDPATRQPVSVTQFGPIPPELVTELPPPPPEPLAALYAAKRAEIRDKANAFLADRAAEYGVFERQTWDTQAAEAVALQADPDAPAPLVRSIAAARGMDALTLAGRILDNKAAWEVLAGHVVGQRLAFQDALDAAVAQAETDPDGARTAIAAIVPAYSLPGA